MATEGFEGSDKLPEISQKQLVGIVGVLCAITVFQGTFQLVAPEAFIEQFNLTDVEVAQVQVTGMVSVLIGFGLMIYTAYTYRLKSTFSWRYFGISFLVAIMGTFIGTSVGQLFLSVVFVAGFLSKGGIQAVSEEFSS